MGGSAYFSYTLIYQQIHSNTVATAAQSRWRCAVSDLRALDAIFSKDLALFPAARS
jgi:hypothetical protein